MIRVLLAAALLSGAIATPGAVANDETGEGFLRFTASRTLRKDSRSVAVSVGLKAAPADEAGWQRARDEDIWFHAVIDARPPGHPGRHRWTDGGSCPAAVTALRRVRAIALPRPVLPIRDPEGLEGEQSIVLDGRVYTLRVDSADWRGQAVGTVTASSNLDTDLSRWAEAMLAVLEPCWSRTAPAGLDATRGTGWDARANPPPSGK